VPGTCGKTDKLDAEGLGILLHNGTLPTVWLPPAEVRDERELLLTRMAFSKPRTLLKNRIHATLTRHAVAPPVSLFSVKGRAWLEEAHAELPPETRRCLIQELDLLDQVQHQIDVFESRIRQRIRTSQASSC
jgi:transposase